jgi:peroxiredoxin
MTKTIKMFVMLSLLTLSVVAATPKVGERAADFSLPSDKGATVSLKDYLGKSKVVLVFYRGSW